MCPSSAGSPLDVPMYTRIIDYQQNRPRFTRVGVSLLHSGSAQRSMAGEGTAGHQGACAPASHEDSTGKGPLRNLRPSTGRFRKGKRNRGENRCRQRDQEFSFGRTDNGRQVRRVDREAYVHTRREKLGRRTGTTRQTRRRARSAGLAGTMVRWSPILPIIGASLPSHRAVV